MYDEIFLRLQLLTSFSVSVRCQRVVVDGVNSDWLPVVSGVPQGSILGPLVFVLYINDLPSIAQHTKIALFADEAKCYLDVQLPIVSISRQI